MRLRKPREAKKGRGLAAPPPAVDRGGMGCAALTKGVAP
jgi:hypothetical protein